MKILTIRLQEGDKMTVKDLVITAISALVLLLSGCVLN